MSDSAKLKPLAQFTREGKLQPGYGQTYLFFTGRDDVHGILRYLIQHEKTELAFNMYAYTDAEINADILALASAGVKVQGTLDASEASLPHGLYPEVALLKANQAGPQSAAFASSFVIASSATHQISHTKGGVCVSQGLAFEGSTNWSKSGQGDGFVPGGPLPHGVVAQNNTLVVTVNKVFIARFRDELDAEHALGKPVPAIATLPKQLTLTSEDDEGE